VGDLGALRALGHLHLLVLLQAAEALALDPGVVHEDTRAVGAGDASPLLNHLTFPHAMPLPKGLDSGPHGPAPGPVLDATSPDP
jgi:hypothetical protein